MCGKSACTVRCGGSWKRNHGRDRGTGEWRKPSDNSYSPGPPITAPASDPTDDEVAYVAKETVHVVGEIPCNPRHEPAIRVGRDACDVNSTSCVVDDEQDTACRYAPVTSPGRTPGKVLRTLQACFLHKLQL